MIVDATYTSVWDGNTYTSPCTYNTETKEVVCHETFDDDGDMEVLEDEYVTLPDGSVIREDFTY